VGDALMLDDPTAPLELGQAPPRVAAGHAQVVRHGHEKRAGVEVTGLRARLDFEDGATWVVEVDRVAVVHHAFEHAERPDAHGVMMAACRSG
jgi:hypothetical protein